MSSYTGNRTGEIPGKMFGGWWKSGATFNNFFNYWHGDGKVLLCCDSYGRTADQYIAKGLFAADLAFVTMLAPYTSAEIIPRLQGSSQPRGSAAEETATPFATSTGLGIDLGGGGRSV
ncbi:hypothetical protein Aspvir_002771 [Aspergillus viridinutans]|uniref:Uncharacterized protein n=1 Tax=Aspergillus viridinutans TaxID=75553 RepID=A0A9P3C8P9_ASPVI|nr:uncharacterized protein Aspvir_002771 [Aspergillus viridinutans]GIK07116.1 hypothetical protein Aspvir_002771 [Aspergillus viridinutans]